MSQKHITEIRKYFTLKINKNTTYQTWDTAKEKKEKFILSMCILGKKGSWKIKELYIQTAK